MCGRYLIASEIDGVIKSYNTNNSVIEAIEKGEMFPGTNIPVIISINGIVTLTHLFWGIKYGSSNIINARFETVDDKPLFKGLLEHCRCIIPASSYYEWKQSGKEKEKMEVSVENTKIISIAGIYGNFKDRAGNYIQSVVILTVPSNEATSHIHHRMPLIITENLKEEWLCPTKLEIDKKLFYSKNYELNLVIKSCSDFYQTSFL